MKPLAPVSATSMGYSMGKAGEGTRGSTKSQAPNPKQLQSKKREGSKPSPPFPFGCFDFDLGICLGFGALDLELAAHRAFPVQRRSRLRRGDRYNPPPAASHPPPHSKIARLLHDPCRPDL